MTNQLNLKSLVVEETEEEQKKVEELIGTWHKPISIKDALFAEANKIIIVKGQIISAGKIHSMLLDGAGMIEARAINIELMDTESYNDIDSLKVILVNELAKNVKIGENCVIAGVLKIDPKPGNRGFGFPVLRAHDLRYLKHQQQTEEELQNELSQQQIDRVHRFIRLANEQYEDDDNTIIDRLVSVYAKQIIKNEHIKEALLYALASTTANLKDGTDMHGRRKRLNVGLIGFPGGGKTFLAKSVLRYNTKNRFESAQSSSGKSLTAMISREGEGGRILRVGAVAHAKQALCVIDEIGELPQQEQSLLQGVMEEGQFTINKFGFNANIRADTVIVWTSNPKNATNSNMRLSYKDLPIRKQILDRTDLLIVQKAITDPEERAEFNRLKLENERASKERKKILSLYDDYLKLHLAVMRRKYSTQDITITEECAELINQADIEIQSKKAEGAGSFRTIDTLIRLAEIIAKLKLKDKADVKDGLRAIMFYNKISTVNMSQQLEDKPLSLINRDPAYLTVNVITDRILKANPGIACTITELAQKAVEINETVKAYLGEQVGDVRTNRRLRRVLDLLTETTAAEAEAETTQDKAVIAKVSQSPARFMYNRQEQQY